MSRIPSSVTSKKQEVYFRKACGVARHAYNWALTRWKEARATGERVKMNDLKREYNQFKGEQFPWCYEVTKCAPEQAFADLWLHRDTNSPVEREALAQL